ncbi:hypothetical protein ANN_17121 [Periplaneta americana]|uniref:Uncharacterized protein n=1 Tax=Periplaneta americana TaxID=6978 RepID=A0ABQ8SS18_PERAM|nr:hypothetical protein ANN_17121 [Periplaneta americana]
MYRNASSGRNVDCLETRTESVSKLYRQTLRGSSEDETGCIGIIDSWAVNVGNTLYSESYARSLSCVAAVFRPGKSPCSATNVLFADANFLLACVRDDTIKVLDLRMNQITCSFRFILSSQKFQMVPEIIRCIFSLLYFIVTRFCKKAYRAHYLPLLLRYSAEGFKVGCDWSRAAFSPDGQYISVGSLNGGVFVWNAITQKLETVLKEHT